MKITLCIPKDKNFKPQLAQELAAARNIKDRATRESVINGLTRIENNYAEETWYLWDGQKLLMGRYPLQDFVYKCGKDFVAPELDIRSLGNKYMFVVMDANHASIGILQGKKIEKIWDETSYVPRKTDMGGQSKDRYRRNRELALKHWMKKVADKMKEAVL